MKLRSLIARDNVRAEAEYGNDATDLDDWQESANPWTVTLRRKRRQLTVNYWTGTAITEDPDAETVLGSLLSDASSADQSFEDWAGDYGYDTDSRKAYATYEAVQSQTEDLQHFLGEDFAEYLRSELP